MKEIYNKVNLVLAAWNPLSVNSNISESEYSSYVPRIVEAFKKNSLEKSLAQLLIEIGAIEDVNNDIRRDIENISSLIIKICQRKI